MSINRLAQDQLNELYIEHREQIFGICKQFYDQYGGEFEEIVSEAHEHFIDLMMTHNPKRASIGGDIQFRLPKRLLESRRLQLRRNENLPRVPMPDNYYKEIPPEFELDDFIQILNIDAAHVVQMVFHPPKEVELAILERGGPEPKNIKASIKEYLKDLGWSFMRVCSCFAEVRQSLS